MATTASRKNERERALAHLARFTARVLPGILRRIGSWKGISAATLQELRRDVVQELTIDCLQDPKRIAVARKAQRHARWIRMTERWVYYQHVRPSRRGPIPDPDALPAPPTIPAGEHVGEGAPARLVCLKNGRCNLQASAHRSGSSVRAVRRRLDDLADQLGSDEAEIQFWQRRLAEALTGLGADLLRRSALLHTLPAAHRAADVPARLRRIRRIANRLPLHRTPLHVRKILARWTRSPHLGPSAARLALEQATTLCPDRAEGWLWLFEAAFAAGDLGAAIVALRRTPKPPGRICSRVVLARARLLEARDRWPAAMHLLLRGHRRRPGEARLREACQQLGARKLRE